MSRDITVDEKEASHIPFRKGSRQNRSNVSQPIKNPPDRNPKGCWGEKIQVIERQNPVIQKMIHYTQLLL